MNPERIAELRAWVACGKRNDDVGAESASISRTQKYHRERAKNWADLLALLSDHEAALPLLEAVKKLADLDFIMDDWPSDDVSRAAATYYERSQPNE